MSLYIKEVRRFLKVQTQTIWAPAVTTLLFLVIFSVALGRGGREVLGVPFASFVAPGLIAMAMMQNSFANSSFSLLSGKIQGTIIDLLMPPLSAGELLVAYDQVESNEEGSGRDPSQCHIGSLRVGVRGVKS